MKYSQLNVGFWVITQHFFIKTFLLSTKVDKAGTITCTCVFIFGACHANLQVSISNIPRTCNSFQTRVHQACILHSFMSNYRGRAQHRLNSVGQAYNMYPTITTAKTSAVRSCYNQSTKTLKKSDTIT